MQSYAMEMPIIPVLIDWQAVAGNLKELRSLRYLLAWISALTGIVIIGIVIQGGLP